MRPHPPPCSCATCVHRPARARTIEQDPLQIKLEICSRALCVALSTSPDRGADNGTDKGANGTDKGTDKGTHAGAWGAAMHGGVSRHGPKPSDAVRKVSTRLACQGQCNQVHAGAPASLHANVGVSTESGTQHSELAVRVFFCFCLVETLASLPHSLVSCRNWLRPTCS